MQRLWRMAKRYAGKAEVLCAVLLGLMAINMVSVIVRKSITNDEVVLIPAAYYHLAAGQFNLVYEHPPLCKLLAGIPLLFLQPNEANRAELNRIADMGQRSWAYEVNFWRDNRKDFESLSFWPRLPMIGLTLGLGVLIFVFARELFGSTAAVFAVALFALEPTVLAHGRIVQTDIPAAFGFLLVFYTLYRYVAAPGMRRAVWIGVAAGVALLAKFSMVIIAPIVLAFFAVKLWQRHRGALRDVAVVSLTTLVIVNAAYFFKHRPFSAEEVAEIGRGFAGKSAFVLRATELLVRVVPTEFVLGVLWQVTHSAKGHTAGLLGMHSKTGWWYYFPVAFALKTTLPFLLLCVAAVLWGCWRAAVRRERKFLWLVAPLLGYTVLLLFSGINIGVRYYLPAYAFLFILGGAALARLTSNSPRVLGAAVAALLLGWCGLAAVRAHPDYLSYMSPLAARHPAWWYLSDSNVEWGEDVRGLAEYLRARGERSVRAALLGGFLTLQFYGIDYVDFLSDQPLPQTRYVALGASFLNGSTVPEAGRTEEERVNRFAAFRHRTPEAIIGGSIWVFRMDE